MGDYGTGPKWAWNAALILAGIGMAAGMVGVVLGTVWLFNHVKIQ